MIDSGSYGCVYGPPKSCVNKRLTPRASFVGKVFGARADFEREMGAYDVVRRIDPKHEWSLPVLNTCEVRMTQAWDCPVITADSAHHLMQIVLPHGGDTLTRALQARPEDAEDLLTQGLTAIGALGEHRLAHMDVKPANMLVDRGTHKLRLIDFGMMQPFETAYDLRRNWHLLATQYVYYPPEFNLFYRISQRFRVADSDLVRAIKKDPDTLNRTADKIDVYGLGVSFLESLPSAKGRMRALLTRMTDPDPRVRIGVKEALAFKMKSTPKSADG